MKLQNNHLKTSRVVEEATQVTITVTEDGVTYGEHYTTEPATITESDSYNSQREN